MLKVAVRHPYSFFIHIILLIYFLIIFFSCNELVIEYEDIAYANLLRAKVGVEKIKQKRRKCKPKMKKMIKAMSYFYKFGTWFRRNDGKRWKGGKSTRIRGCSRKWHYIPTKNSNLSLEYNVTWQLKLHLTWWWKRQ